MSVAVLVLSLFPVSAFAQAKNCEELKNEIAMKLEAKGVKNYELKIVAAAEVCLNNAIRGDLRSFAKAMEIAEKFQLLKPGLIEGEIASITRTIIDPKGLDTLVEK